MKVKLFISWCNYHFLPKYTANFLVVYKVAFSNVSTDLSIMRFVVVLKSL